MGVKAWRIMEEVDRRRQACRDWKKVRRWRAVCWPDVPARSRGVRWYRRGQTAKMALIATRGRRRGREGGAPHVLLMRAMRRMHAINAIAASHVLKCRWRNAFWAIISFVVVVTF